MYTLAVKRDFIARHFLIGGDWGQENQKHSHHYRIEVQLKGNNLDSHNYLVDIVQVNEQLDILVSYLREKTLNDLPEFENTNPSIETLAYVSYHLLYSALKRTDVTLSRVKVWEDEVAWVAYQEE